MIRIGVAGWDYADWKGPVYPRRCGRDFDRLEFISRFVDVVEINSSFYRPVDARHAESWLRRTSARREFRFTAKTHRTLSHETAGLTAPDWRRALSGLEPLRDAGRLGALLLQFPQSFHDTLASRGRVERLAEALHDWPLVVEVRHRSWEAAAGAAWLRELGLAWCVVDQPVLDSTLRCAPCVTAEPGYLRLHGRNAAAWFRADAGRDARYDYLYSADEVDRLARTVRAMTADAAEIYVIQNNHFRGQALVNALQMKGLLQPGLPPAPRELVSCYPELASRVQVEAGGLF